MLAGPRLRRGRLLTQLSVSHVQFHFDTPRPPAPALLSDTAFPVIGVFERYYRRLTQWVWSAGPLVLVMERQIDGKT